MMKTFLVSCYYEHYCQGYEETHGTFLVEAISYNAACEVLKIELKKARDFRNMTFPVEGIPTK